MCYSAEASFAGAAVVTAAGVGALALCRERREVPFAALPLLFGVHQALEGLTWVELGSRDGASLSGFGVHTWVFFAWAFLPVYVPWAVRLLEDDPRRRRAMAALWAVGIAVGAFMLERSLRPEIGVSVVHHQLDYHLGTRVSALWVAVPYVAATCVTPILSSHRWVRIFGVGNVIALGIAAWVESKDFSSIWCTLAAFLSLLILAHYLEQWRRRRATDAAPPAPTRPSATQA